LEAEEERANKIIEDTKNKVQQILKSRAANEQLQRDLEHSRDQELKRKQKQVQKRMQARLSQITPQQAAGTIGSPHNSYLDGAESHIGAQSVPEHSDGGLARLKVLQEKSFTFSHETAEQTGLHRNVQELSMLKVE